MKYRLPFLLAGLLLALPFVGTAQTKVVDSNGRYLRTVIAGPEYKRGGLHRFIWGRHYRKEWTTPVTVKVLNIDSLGLVPTEQGGGRQTKTLRLKNARGKEYVLRSIDKDYRGALPEIAAGTFIEGIAKDQVSTAHPFAAITIPGMIESAGVYHTTPQIVLVPYTPSLGDYNKTFANMLCLFEERPDDDQSDAPNFGNAKDVVGTEKMFEKLYGDNDNRVDQKAYVRARLFDMFLGDWGRHEDQWRWGKFKSDGATIYKPIPRDRDQTYTKFDGLLVRLVTGIETLEHLQTFSDHIKNVKKYNFPARHLDRQLSNEVPQQVWMDIAKELQQSLTDPVIEASVRQLPPELFAISGEGIIRKLKSRRDDLPEIAAKYYKFITKEVEVVGTEKAEYFSIQKNADGSVQLDAYDLDSEGKPKSKPFYSRNFLSSETHEIRVLGLKGNDQYRVSGSNNNSIKVRIIGGTDKDVVTNETDSKVRYYDNRDNTVTGRFRQHLSNSDTAISKYDYKGFKENVGFTIKLPSYTNTRGIHFNGGYVYTRHHWRKEPYSWRQLLSANYSFTNKSFGADYNGLFIGVIGKWNLAVTGRYDERLKNYFFGFGNETKVTQDRTYYNLYTKEAVASLGLIRPIGQYQTFGITGFYQGIKVENQNNKLVSQQLPSADPSVFQHKNFAGAAIDYAFLHLNDLVVPTKGGGLSLNVSHTENLTQKSRDFTRYTASGGFYIPFSKTISLAVRTSASTINGEPEFYQLNNIGGGGTLRGFNRQRFYGRTSFFDNNEIRWIPNFRSYIFNGKIGLIGFFDNGRVWQSGEESGKWHFGYGGGLMIVPFNKIAITAYYGVSEEDSRIHIRLGRFF